MREHKIKTVNEKYKHTFGILKANGRGAIGILTDLCDYGVFLQS